ncbi:hypothetical protein TYRP_010951 [Tyrophagus putrescentiae]|nr:hypothetical protein TYRP_010951 [Tyrophagus putrescentiae]
MIDIPDPTFLKCFQNHRLSVNWLAFSPNSNYLASASDDKTVYLWNLNRNNTCYKFTGHSDAITSVALANSFMISGSKDNTARLWRLSDRGTEGLTYSSESSIYRAASPISSVDINAGESQFCTSSDDRMVKLWSTTSTKYITSLSGEHTNWVRHARFSKLSPFLLSSCGDDGIICIWDVRSKTAAIKLNSKRRATHYLGVQWHPNCEYILSSSSSDSSLRIWDLRYEKIIQCYQVHEGVVSSSDFHSTGNYLISSSLDQTCKILDLFEGRTLFTLRAHVGHVNCAQFSPNGEHFATAGQDRAVLYWKSNIASIDELASELEDDDMRSICSFADTPQINTFNADKINKSTRSSMMNGCGSGKISSNGGGHFGQVKQEHAITEESDAVEVKCETSSPTPPSSGKSTPVNGNGVNGTGGAGLDFSCVDILKSILQQLEVITDSIVNIDQRLSTLEETMEKPSG